MQLILKTVSHEVEKNFYDPSLKGLNWKALTEEASRKIDNAKSNSEMISAIYSLVDKLNDSHTKFLPPGRVDQSLYGFNAKPFGSEILIYELKKGGAAEKAGLHLGDHILGVNGFTAERASFDLLMLVTRVLRPLPEMRIVYSRAGAPPQTIDVAAKIKKGSKLVDLTNEFNIWTLIRESETEHIDYLGGFGGEIGYLQIPDFSAEEITSIHKLNKYKAFVIDLRGNPGGRVSTLLELAGHFTPENSEMGSVISRKKTEPLKVHPRNPNLSGPVVVLVDSNSGSAAEMFARYLQLSRKATVVGDHTPGRVNASEYFSEHVGTDSVVPFGIQISIGRVVLSNGEQLEQRGVVPDIACVPTGEDVGERRDPCLKVAIAAARKMLGGSDQLSEESLKQIDNFARGVAQDKQNRLDAARD
jgi:C-terminal processing protease CtpA/Prc